MNAYSLESNVILPFRALIEPVNITATVPGEKRDTSFALFYKDKVNLSPEGAPEVLLDVTSCSMITINKTQLFDGDIDSAKKWAHKEVGKIISDQIIPSINYFLILIKYNKPSAFHTGVIRNVGQMDFVFCNLFLEDDVIFSSGSSTLINILSPNFEKCKLNPESTITDDPPKEWTVLTRSVDLINHGYLLEGFIIAFALLDDLTQEFFKDNIPNLEREEAEEFLRKIETQRLKTYFGPLSRIVKGKSLLDETHYDKRLKWLNTKRNKIMHSGEEINLNEAKKGLEIVIDFLKFLNDIGAKFVLPEKLEFW